jgi:diadenylate cyclase
VNETIKPLLDLFREVSWRSVVSILDILLVTFLVYKLFSLVRGTRAIRIVAGIAFFLLALFVSKWLQLDTLHWLLEKATLLGPVALVILLLPELRQALEGFGQLGLWTQKLVGTERSDVRAETVEQIVAAAAEMSAARIGALIVIEQTSPVTEIVASGVPMNAHLSTPLLVSIFYEGNPLHDGAAVIKGDQIVAAACRLPLSENPRLDAALHMRHRAGIGVSEQYDCLVIIVSEERGTISVVRDGHLKRMAGYVELREVLNRELRHVADEETTSEPRRRLFNRGTKLR